MLPAQCSLGLFVSGYTRQQTLSVTLNVYARLPNLLIVSLYFLTQYTVHSENIHPFTGAVHEHNPFLLF